MFWLPTNKNAFFFKCIFMIVLTISVWEYYIYERLMYFLVVIGYRFTQKTVSSSLSNLFNYLFTDSWFIYILTMQKKKRKSSS